jgi:hypothetical protein
MKHHSKKREYSWINPKMVMKKKPLIDNGIFAKAEIKKDELLAVFGGYVMTLKEESRLPEKIRDYSHQISPEFVIGVIDDNRIQKVDYFNHSCNPNAGFKGQIFLVAMRKIKKGEEVTFDYAMVLSHAPGVELYKMKCLCGSTKCRGYVTEDDWKIPELQKKYRGYFQYFLQEMIDKKT